MTYQTLHGDYEQMQTAID